MADVSLSVYLKHVGKSILRNPNRSSSPSCHGHHIYPLVNIQKNYGKSPCLMGKSTISMVIFNSYVKLPEGYIYIYLEMLEMDGICKNTMDPDGLLSFRENLNTGNPWVFIYHQIKRLFRNFPIIQFYPWIQITMLRLHGCGSSESSQAPRSGGFHHPMAWEIGVAWERLGRVGVISRWFFELYA